MQNKDQHIDIRVKKRMSQVRTILKMRVDLLEKDIGAKKMEQVKQAIAELSLDQLNKLRNVTTNIADEILTVWNNK